MNVIDPTARASLRVLLTGATGYIGGRLLRLLETRGYRVRCLARRPEALRQKVGPSTELIAGNVLERTDLDIALRGVDAAFYLVHSMGSESFEESDRIAAQDRVIERMQEQIAILTRASEIAEKIKI